MSDALVGAWCLNNFIIYFDGADPIYPFGKGAAGSLIYAECGRMSAQLTRTDRKPLSISRLESFAKAPDAEKVAAFDGYLSYAGSYEFDGDRVTHFVELASVPNLVGAEQVRYVELDEDDLTLSYSVGTRRYVLRWQRETPI